MCCKQLSKSPLEQGNSSYFLCFSCESELIPVKSLYNFQEIPAIQRGPECGEFPISKCTHNLQALTSSNFQARRNFLSSLQNDSYANQQEEVKNLTHIIRSITNLTQDGEHVPRTAIRHEELEDSRGNIPASPHLSP
jgi:hypothetical protein